MSKSEQPKPVRDMDAKVKIDLPTDVAIDALLKVDPDDVEALDAIADSGGETPP